MALLILAVLSSLSVHSAVASITSSKWQSLPHSKWHVVCRADRKILACSLSTNIQTLENLAHIGHHIMLAESTWVCINTEAWASRAQIHKNRMAQPHYVNERARDNNCVLESVEFVHEFAVWTQDDKFAAQCSEQSAYVMAFSGDDCMHASSRSSFPSFHGRSQGRCLACATNLWKLRPLNIG